jgi:hypothetical protein
MFVMLTWKLECVAFLVFFPPFVVRVFFACLVAAVSERRARPALLCSVLRSLCAGTRSAALLMPSSLFHFCHSFVSVVVSFVVVVVVVVSEIFFEAGIGCFLCFMYVFCRKANVGY